MSYFKGFYSRLMSASFALLCGLAVFMITRIAFGDEVVIPPEDFATQVFNFIKGFGGLSGLAKVSGVLLVLISSMKVSFLRPLWDKLGWAKALLAPLLAIGAGVLSLGANLTWAGVASYVFAGAGAVFLHEVLDSAKEIPGVGGVWVQVIEWVKGLLGAPNPAPVIVEVKK